MSHFLTLIAPAGKLETSLLPPVRDALSGLGAAPATPDWLSPGEAVDLPFADLAPEQAVAAAQAALGAAPVDVIATPAEGRRKMLLLADMDSTIVTTETLDEMAAFAGKQAEIVAITKRSMNGEIDFATALRERVAMLAGLDASALQKTWEATQLTPGAQELVATMRAHGAYCALASGGFTWFTALVAEAAGFNAHFANELLLAGGKLTGKVGEPILDRDAKLTTLKRLAAENGLGLAATLAVGDGANDLAMLQAAGLGIAFHAKPVVAAAARAKVEHTNLRALLFAQGYHAAEFRAG